MTDQNRRAFIASISSSAFFCAMPTPAFSAINDSSPEAALLDVLKQWVHIKRISPAQYLRQRGVDISDLLFATTGLVFEGEPNDGITGVCSNHFGRVLRDNYIMNHIDINNHVLGIVSLLDTNPKTVFKNHANRLKKLGL